MSIHTSFSFQRAARLALAAAIILGSMAACGTQTPGSGAATPSSATVDRADPKQVSDAFMAAYASGDLTAACAMGSDALQQKLKETDRCVGPASWNVTATGSKGCFDEDGYFWVTYEASGYIDRYLTFIVSTKSINDQWTVDRFFAKAPSSVPDYTCVNNGAGSSGVSTG